MWDSTADAPVSYAVPASSKSQICRRFRVSKGQLAPITR